MINTYTALVSNSCLHKQDDVYDKVDNKPNDPGKVIPHEPKCHPVRERYAPTSLRAGWLQPVGSTAGGDRRWKRIKPTKITSSPSDTFASL